MQARDILSEMEKMEESGMEQSWARAVADTIVKAIEPLATKSDLKAMRKELKADDEALRKEFKAEFQLMREEVKNQILSMKIWIMVSQFMLFGGLVATNLLL